MVNGFIITVHAENMANGEWENLADNDVKINLVP